MPFFFNNFYLLALSVSILWVSVTRRRHIESMDSEEKNTLEAEQIELPAYPPTGYWGRVYRRLEGKLSKLCFENNFFYKILTWKYLPLASKAGMKLGKRHGDVYETVLPFKSFNKNWYDAMAGAALLANTEIAGGMAIFQYVGEKYTVVCKDLSYKFRLPCHSDATYRVKIMDDIHKLMKTKPEFNLRMEIDVLAEMRNKVRKIGTSSVTFHIAAKSLMAQRIHKAKQKAKA